MAQFLIFFVAAMLVVLASANFAAGGIAASRVSTRDRLRRYNTLRSFRSAAEIIRLDAQLQATVGGSGVGSGSGAAWRVMEVAEVVEESADCRSFYLVDPHGQPLPQFRPGQYLMVRPAKAGAFQTTRCYSLSSAPDSLYWRITVKRQSPAVLQPMSRGGGLSAWLHDNIEAGDCLLIGGPGGHFFLPPENRAPLVLLAAGVGVTPMASMLRWNLEQTPSRPVTLYYQVRDTLHWPLGKYLHHWVRGQQHCRVVSYFSRLSSQENKELLASEIDWSEGKYTAAEIALGQAAGSHYFMCGPDGWMEELRRGLADQGVAPLHIHWESFGGAAVPSEPSPTAGEQKRVQFSRSGVEAIWSDPEQTVWELARAHDVELPSGCLSGVCGSCRVKCRGEVIYDRPVGVELAGDECLSCIARPKTDLQIVA